MKYDVVIYNASDIKQMAEEMDKRIEQGWKLQGPAMPYVTVHGTCLAQTLYKS